MDGRFEDRRREGGVRVKGNRTSQIGPSITNKNKDLYTPRTPIICVNLGTFLPVTLRQRTPPLGRTHSLAEVSRPVHVVWFAVQGTGYLTGLKFFV